MPGSRHPNAPRRAQADGCAVIRFLLIFSVLAGTAGAVLAYGDPQRISLARDIIADLLVSAHPPAPRTVDIERTSSGDFALQATINGAPASMIVDTGATSVVLTYETAKAAGLPLELLDYNVAVDTANGRMHAARLTLDQIAIGKLVERSVPALVVPRGQMKNNLLGMSFLDRLESWEVRADRLTLNGYP